MPVELPPQLVLLEAVAPREETTSSRLSLKEEIDQFQLEEEREEQGDPVIHISDPEDEFDKTSSVHTLGFVVAKIDDSSEVEEEEMARNQGRRPLVSQNRRLCIWLSCPRRCCAH